MKTNITVLLPVYGYQKKLSKIIAEKLGMLFADVKELLSFEISDIEKALSVGGKEYLDKQERKLIKRLASYKNTLINIDVNTFLQEANREVLKKNSVVVYFNFNLEQYKKLLRREKKSEEYEINVTLFNKRDKLLKSYADIIVNCQNTNKRDILKLFISEVNNFYKKKDV